MRAFVWLDGHLQDPPPGMPQRPTVRLPVTRPVELRVPLRTKRKRRQLARRGRGPGRRRAVAVKEVKWWLTPVVDIIELRAHRLADRQGECLLYLPAGEEVRREHLQAVNHVCGLWRTPGRLW